MGSGDDVVAHGVCVGVQAHDQSGKIGHAQIHIGRTEIVGEHRHLEEPKIRHLGHNDPTRSLRILRPLRAFG